MSHEKSHSLGPRDAEFAVNYLKEFADNISAAISVMIAGATDAENGKLDVYTFAPIMRMTTSWTMLSLAKTVELWAKYGRFASPEVVTDMRRIVNEIESRGIVDFRNRTIAHLLDRETKDPLMPEEIQSESMKIMRNDMPAFFQWLIDPTGQNPHTVCATLLRFRQCVLAIYPLTRVTC